MGFEEMIEGLLRRVVREELAALRSAPTAEAILLVMAANPPAEELLEAEKEHSRINKTLNGSTHRANITIVADLDVDLPEFSRNLRLHKPVAVHLAGHGGEDGSFVMRDEDGQAVSMTVEGLAKLLVVTRETTRLVVLSACYSNELATLLVNDIDCVIGMAADVSDQAAALFSQSFYGVLFDGESVGVAYATALAAVVARYPEDGNKPVLQTRKGVAPATITIV